MASGRREDLCWADQPDTVKLTTEDIADVILVRLGWAPQHLAREWQWVAKTALQRRFPCQGPIIQGKPYPNGHTIPFQ